MFDGHIQAFSFFGGIFPVLIYDNLTTAVQRVYLGKKRDLQQSYDKFVGYYFPRDFVIPERVMRKEGLRDLRAMPVAIIWFWHPTPIR